MTSPPVSKRSTPLPRWIGAGALLCALAGCAGGGGNQPVGDPVRMSQSEHDIAVDLWLRQNEPRRALEHALKATELDEENHEAFHLVALIYLDFCRRTPEDCRLQAAEKYARRAVELKTDFREAVNTLGVVLIHRRQYAEAIEVLLPLTADILYQTPENAWGNLGWAYLESGSLKKAIAALQRSVAAQPLFCVGNYRLGVAYERNGQPRLAAEALTRALETDDPGCRNLQEALAARGRVALRLGDAKRAREDLETCHRLAKDTKAGKECSALLRKLK